MERLDNKTEEMTEDKREQAPVIQERKNPDYDSLEGKIERLKDDIDALKRIKHQQKKLDKLEEKKLEILRDIEKPKGKGGHHRKSVKRSSKH